MARKKEGDDGERSIAVRPPPRLQPQQGYVPPRFAVQAAWAGAKLLMAGVAGMWSLKPADWVSLITLIAQTCLRACEGVGGYEALVQATSGKCVLANKPYLIRAQLHGGQAWLQEAVFQAKQGYWQLRMPRVKSTAIARCRGVKPDSNLKGQAQKTLSINVHHLITWWAWGRPSQSEHDQACHWYCGNKLCLNPHHLYMGSVRDNAYHRTWHAEKGRGLHASLDSPDRHAPPGWKSVLSKASSGLPARPHRACSRLPCV